MQRICLASSQDRCTLGVTSMELEPPNTYLGAAHNQAIVDLAEDAIIAMGRDRRILLFNRGAVKTFGFQAAEAIGQSLDILLPQRLVRPHKNHIRDFASAPEAARRMGERGEILGRRKDRSEFPAEASISKAQVAGEWLFTIILRDVTDRKLAERQIEASLREKEALLIEKEAMLKEIHHRVKNNLQVVSGLLGLQARVIPDQTTRKLFQESQNRIHSMALVHERLYLSENLSEIDSHEYMSQLAAHLFRAYGVSVSRIKLTINTEATRLSTDAAVPCGLILNELVSNSLKYAFPGGREGEIRIELRRNGLRPCCLIVADNGVGLPKNVTLWSTKSLGLRLVKILADQIGAAVQVSSSGGTEVKLMFHEESSEDDTDENSHC